ncbi:glycosyltransferase family 2 protein [Shouchella lonarensis]|uniref:Glycosyltransferase, catalytic subunit of cellulose synthase and poly-beta-1,6-N-acetylglucosamine synthase n=1 Tax=Shouchella lonarensis TaxID=1464122 RepID=A0A1G6H097_9BACI|nr:glycosyltransferase family 2 protein [Shouchella lonarensis]SDB87679.1 Glycosyltransferase, catalytic subunit of cellulose synthase and poly-beta-1,6-N-acetylglucosamine synthase [Shouchella lonarensis]
MKKPFFSVLLVVRNEERDIEGLLTQLLKQQSEQFLMELIVIDGMSTDQTKAIVMRYQATYPQIKLLENPRQTLPAGWNIGIRAAQGDYILRIDGHTAIPDDFLLRYTKTIEAHPEADVVGGVIDSKGRGFQGEINAYVYAHPFGVGNSKFRTLKNTSWEGYVDTVPYGAYKREIFAEVGFFNETLKRNEDIEFHKRMKDAGKRFFLSTTITSTYFVRPTLRTLIKKSLGDGKWTVIANKRTPGASGVRQKAPLVAFVLGLLFTILSFFHLYLFAAFLLMVSLYVGVNAYASVGIARKKGWRALFPCMVTFFCLHFFRGWGSFSAYFSRDYWRL